jgi:hypothetical protein
MTNNLAQVLDTLKINRVNFTQDSSAVTPIDTLSFADSLLNTDSLRVEAKKGKMIPLYQTPLSVENLLIKKHDFLRIDYRYAADFFKLSPFFYLKDYGTLGQPNDLFLYGTNSKGISFFEDGVYHNNRYSNLLDLNHFQSESVDSIEIAPLPRGFIYGPYNNTVSVNLISKDPSPSLPYTRVKYYEGPYDETMIDGLFSVYVFRQLIASAEITNRIASNRYLNTDYSVWQAKAKLKYLLSDSINLIGTYRYSSSETGLNGGVDVDSILQATQNLESVLYNNLEAPVITESGRLKVKQHHFGLRLLSSFSKNSETDLTLFYKFYLDENSNGQTGNSFTNKFRNKLWGAFLKQGFKFDFLDARLFANYESNKFKDSYSSGDILKDNYSSMNLFSIAGILSAYLLDSAFVPSVFYKYAHYDYQFGENSYSGANPGFGFDVKYYLSKFLNFYAGYSEYKPFYSDLRIKTAELGAKFLKENFLADLKLFNRKNFNLHYPVNYINSSYTTESNIWGLSSQLGIRVWKIFLEARASYYDITERWYDGITTNNPPDVIFTTGLFFRDFLFNDNLDLKAGFEFTYFGKQTISFSPNIDLVGGSDLFINPSNRLDFIAAGEIQKVAIVYFTWENLFDNDYYLVRFYPVPERNIRFGLSWELFN